MEFFSQMNDVFHFLLPDKSDNEFYDITMSFFNYAIFMGHWIYETHPFFIILSFQKSFSRALEDISLNCESGSCVMSP